MNNNENKLIPASTVLIIRNGKTGIEVFMVVRHHEIDFASGALVFPGGKVDRNDYDEKLKNLSYIDEESESENLPFKIAAIRESFEEANVLFANDNTSNSIVSINRLKNLNKWREKFNNNTTSMLEFASGEDLSFSTKSLIPFAHWITPEKMPKRFDTRFFLAKVNAKQLASHDGFELTESFWIKPADALVKLTNGEMNMILPTIKNIEKLAEFSSSEEAFNYFQGLGDNAIPPILPKFIKKDGEWIGFLPGEEGYNNV